MKALGYISANEKMEQTSLQALDETANQKPPDNVNQLHIKIIQCNDINSRQSGKRVIYKSWSLFALLRLHTMMKFQTYINGFKALPFVLISCSRFAYIQCGINKYLVILSISVSILIFTTHINE